jgi:tetratricopeptide (TPR) repeat protein
MMNRGEQRGDECPMTQRIRTRLTLDEAPRVSRNLKLTCAECGRKRTYDVGTIFFSPQAGDESTEWQIAFSNYFHCVDCGSGGPWEVVNYGSLIGLALRAGMTNRCEGFFQGRIELFDGTSIQTPAMGEDYLRALIDKEPHNPFLHTRLGNLLRVCGEQQPATVCYEKALALDADDPEARYHLYSFAAMDFDVGAAIRHAMALVRALLEGRRTGSEELIEGIALTVMMSLRKAPPELRTQFLQSSKTQKESRAWTFIRDLLDQEGDEETIATEFADRLLAGEVGGGVACSTHDFSDAEIQALSIPGDDDSRVGPVPSLREVIVAHGLKLGRLSVPLEGDGEGSIRVQDRHKVPLYDNDKFAYWPVASLRELFRGDRQPPVDMDHYPEEYCQYFFFIEEHLLMVCEAIGDRTDQEMEQIFSTLRRRPDGRSLGMVHDFIWQVAALMLGKYELSEAEFEALVGQLERSVRKWALRPVSRNYAQHLRSSLTEYQGADSQGS